MKKKQVSPISMVVFGLLGAGLLMLPVVQFKSSQKELAIEGAKLQSTIKQQEMFKPIVDEISRDMSLLQGFVKRTPPLVLDLPMPTSFADAAASLQVLVIELGLGGALLIPDSESVVGANSMVRIDGTMEGSLEAFRSFVLQLSALSWVDRIERTEISAGTSWPLYKISLWVKVNPE